MVITVLHDVEDLLNQADIFLFGVNKEGKFTTLWVEEEIKTNPAMYASMTKYLLKAHHKDVLKGISSKDENGIYRFFFSCLVPEDGKYTDNQILALKHLLERTVKSNRDYPLMDMFGSIFDMLSDHPTDQPGGIYISGPPTKELQDQLKKILGDTMIDCFLYDPLDGKVELPKEDLAPKKKKKEEELEVEVDADKIDITLEQEKGDDHGSDSTE